MSSLHRNPFHVLGATTRDGRGRVLELAEERALVADEDACREAQNALINLRGRLAAEMAWFPGVSPRKASEMAERIGTTQFSLAADDLPPMARANALASHLESLPPHTDPSQAAPVIMRLAEAVEDVEPEDVLRDINEDRSVAGFQPVRDAGIVLEEFEARKRDYRNAVRNYLNRLPSLVLVKLVDDLVERCTDGGKRHVPAVIQDMADVYETGAQVFIERESANLRALIERARGAVPHGELNVAKVLDDIERAVTNFGLVVRPIQVVCHVNGTDHDPSISLAFALRKLAVDLHNEQGWHALPTRITDILAAGFPHVGEVRHTVETDAQYLREAAEQRRLAEEEKREFEQSLRYEADLGTIFKDKVAMSAQAIEWRNQRFPLDAITRISWGGTRHSVNGVPAGTTHLITIGDVASTMTIKLRSQTVYDGLTDRLWKAVGPRLMLDTLRCLKRGETIPLPGGTLRDDGVVLTRRKFFGNNETVLVSWDDLKVWSQDGNFIIAKKDEPKVRLSMSYQNNDNTHVVESVIRAGFKKGMRRLSELLA